MSPRTEITGLSLKLERVGRRVKQYEIAHAMGVSASRVAKIEREAVVSDEVATRYLAALAHVQHEGSFWDGSSAA